MAKPLCEVKDYSKQVIRDLRNSMQLKMADLALEKVDEVKSKIHNKTGNLADSIVGEIRSQGDVTELWIGASVSNGKKGHHAHLVEFGHEMANSKGEPTGKQVPPHPFLRPATKSLTRNLKTAFQQAVKIIEAKNNGK